tara:strand:+ start:154 stop:1047 length:894 start_codon:yes stop_codon:yes gene_type:complete
MENDLISVLIPVYNSEKYLEESIKSIINQKFRNLEIILMNDGSTDQSGEICRKYKTLDKRIVYVESNHIGLTNILVKGFGLAKGKFIARQDSDDYSENLRFVKQLDWFKKSKEGVLCGTNCNIILENGASRKNWSIKYKDKDIKKRLAFSNCFTHSSVMFLKEAAQKVGGYDPEQKYSQDYDLWWKLSEIGELGNITDKLVTIRESKSSITSQNKIQQTEYFIKSAIKYFKSKNKNYTHAHIKKLSSEEYLNLLRFYYNDKLYNKVFFKDLNFRQKLVFFLNNYMVNKKLVKFIKNI